MRASRGCLLASAKKKGDRHRQLLRISVVYACAGCIYQLVFMVRAHAIART